MAQGADPPDITIKRYHLDVVDQFTYLGSTITSDLLLDTVISKRGDKASTARHRLTQRVWEDKKLPPTQKCQFIVHV